MIGKTKTFQMQVLVELLCSWLGNEGNMLQSCTPFLSIVLLANWRLRGTKRALESDKGNKWYWMPRQIGACRVVPRKAWGRISTWDMKGPLDRLK